MRALPLLVMAMLLLSGCATQDPVEAPGPAEPDPRPVHQLAGLVEPEDLIAPTFHLLGAVAEGGPAYALGEPGVWADLDGSVYATFPGCPELTLLIGGCAHGQVYRSDDDGETWKLLNGEGGRLGDDGPAANGDADVAVDSAGTIYVSNLGGGGIQLHKSMDGGATWEYMANIVPQDEDGTAREGADRQWVTAAGPGHIINAWMRTSPSRDVEINSTFDGGANWTGSSYFGDGIGWVGTPQFAPDGMHAYVPYTQPGATTTPAGGVLGNGQTFQMHVIRTADGGATWEDVPTGMTWTTSETGLHWSGGYMAPTLDVTGDGTVVVAMAVDDYPATPAPAPANVGSTILVRTSSDNGTTWSETRSFNENALGNGGGMEVNVGSRIFPWVTGGAGDRFAITYLSAPTPVQSDFGGTVWALEAIVVDGIDGDVVETTIDSDVHQGPICARGGACAFPVDRTLLDYFESDVTPDGRLVIAYPADSYVGSQRNIQVRFAIQDGGGLLGVPA